MKKMQGVGLEHCPKCSKRLKLSAETGGLGVNTDQLVYGFPAAK